MSEKFYTVGQAAKIIGVSRQTIHNWLPTKFPGKQEVQANNGTITVIPQSDIERVALMRVKELLEEAEEKKREARELKMRFQPVAA